MPLSHRSQRAVYSLVIASFFTDFLLAASGLAVQNLGIYIHKAPDYALGLLGAMSAVAYTIGCLFTGALSDRYGRKRCVVAACIMCSATWFIIPQMRSWVGVVMIVPFTGLGMSLFWPSIQAWLAELSTDAKSLNRNLGMFNVMWSFGLTLGPLATGYLWGVNHLATFYLPGILLLGIIPLTLLTPRGQQSTAQIEAGEEPHPRADLFLRLAWIGNFTICFVGATILTLFPKLGSTLEYSTATVGWMLFSYRAAGMLMFALVSIETRWQYRLWPMVATEALAVIGLVFAIFAKSPVLFVLGFALAGACAGVTYVASLFYSLHGNKHEKGHMSGLHEAVLGSGMFLGPLVGGFAAQATNLRAPYIVCMIALGIAITWQILWYQKANRRLEQ